MLQGRGIGGFQNAQGYGRFQARAVTTDPTGPRALGSDLFKPAPGYESSSPVPTSLFPKINPEMSAKAEQLSETPTRWAEVQDRAIRVIPLSDFRDPRPRVESKLTPMAAQPSGSCRLSTIEERSESIATSDATPQVIDVQPISNGGGIPASLMDLWERAKPRDTEDWIKYAVGAAAGIVIGRYILNRRRS